MKQICKYVGISLLVSGSLVFAAEPQPAAAPLPDIAPASASTTGQASARPASVVPPVLFRGNGFQIPTLNAKQEAAEVPAIHFTFESRNRNESYNNLWDASDYTDDENIVMRYKDHAALTYTSAPVDFMFGVCTELKKHMALNHVEVAGDTFSNAETDSGSIVVEYLNFDFKKLFVPGLELKVGRLDYEKNDGFVYMDGTPGDGSRTNYSNMADLIYQRAKSKIELIATSNPSREHYLPIVHRNRVAKSYEGAEWNETAIGAYYTDHNIKRADIDVYYFLKKELKETQYPNTSYQFQPDRHISTLGGRVAYRFRDGFSLRGEFAGQWGAQHANLTPSTTKTVNGTGICTPGVVGCTIPVSGAGSPGNPVLAQVTGYLPIATNGYIPLLSAYQPAKNIAAGAGQVFARKDFAANPRAHLEAGYIGMSGNDPKDPGTIKNWDPIFARWPHYSEMYLYNMLPEVGIGYWTNNQMLKLEGGISPKLRHMKTLNVSATYYNMWAIHPFMPGASAINWPPFLNADGPGQNIVVFSQTGTHRGSDTNIHTDFEFNDRWCGKINYDFFDAGDFYNGGPSGKTANGFFVQSEIIYHLDNTLFRFHK